ncbi:MAG: ABC transporter permease [Chloroflexota bacterium]|nr:ABC transporter permease [Chloroflexota bacterium]
MTKYLLRRFLLSIPTIIGVTLLVFIILFLAPGDPAQMILGPRGTPEQVDALRQQLGLDRPVFEQYLRWLGGVLTGNLGQSIAARQPATTLITQQMPYTLTLALSAIVLIVVCAIPIGVFSAVRRNSWADKGLSAGSMFFYSLPDFWLAIMLMLVFAIQLRWLPISGAGSWQAVILPALALGLPHVGTVSRLMRAEMIDVLGEHYIRTAHAKGLSPIHVNYGHALRNALAPIIVYLFLTIPWLLGGAVIVETIFAYPGIGRLMFQSILSRDLPVVQGILLIIATSTVVFNLLGDFVTAQLDPRIRY